MVGFSISRASVDPNDVYLPWDTTWNRDQSAGDWALSNPTVARNRGGLMASDGIATAVILALFTDRACPPDHPLAKYADGDLRGWWGDGVGVDASLGEEPMGSLLWLLERAVATPDIARWAETFALDALAPLIKAGVAVRTTAVAEVDPPAERINLAVALIGADGSKTYGQTFDIVWRQRGS